MSLIEELKRRKVFKVGAAYLVVGWLIIEVVATVMPQLNFPEWAPRLITFVILIGFPIALVLAWVFEVTPEGVKLDTRAAGSKRVLFASAVLAALALGWYVRGRPAAAPATATAQQGASSKAAAAATAAPAKPAIDPRSIAVLPFLNMSDDKDNSYFADGISEELLNVLVKVNGFSVASRTSAFAFKDKEISTAQIARQLGVKYVLEGSVRKQGDEVRITAQLIDALTDRHVFSETYDRKLADIFKVQDEIANAIVDTVRSSVGEASTGKAVTVRADTDNLNAYQSYLKARELFIARRELKESVRLFEHAVELDPKFARGWEGLAAANSIMKSWGIDDRDYPALAEKAAHRAIELDPKLSMAWAALGNVEQARVPVDWAKSLDTLDRAIELDPKNSTAMLWRSNVWLKLGFFQKAIADYDRCLAVDPQYGHCKTWKALALVVSGEQEQGLALYDLALSAGATPHHGPLFATAAIPRSNRLQWFLYMDAQRISPALSRILVNAITHPELAHPNYAQLETSYPDDLKNSSDSNFDREVACMWLGEFDCMASDPGLSSNYMFHWLPGVPGLRNSHGFKATLERLGVPEYWRKHGYPPQCHAVGASDYSCDVPALKAGV
ncbi:hypothetical protein BH11PSE14_BH11PSE14_05810 [soil metagenome]